MQFEPVHMFIETEAKQADNRTYEGILFKAASLCFIKVYKFSAMHRKGLTRMLNLCLIFGGMSGEHSVSCVSASYVAENLDTEKYNVYKKDPRSLSPVMLKIPQFSPP